MKTKEQLEEEAKGYFMSYPKENIFLITADGLFFREVEGPAAKKYAERKGIEIFEVTRPGTQKKTRKKTVSRKKKETEPLKKDQKEETKNLNKE